MRLAYHTQIYLFILLTWVEDLTAAKKSQCPIGFNIGYTESEKPICYRQKGPEMFTDKFKDCIGNMYTAKLYHSMRLRTNKVLWTDYKSLYPGAPFIDQSYTESSGSLLASPSFSSFDVKYDSSLGLDEELCVVIDPVSNFTATRCNEKHYRFCFVEPYPEEEDMSRKGCTEFRGSWRFFSPSANCLMPVTGVGGGTVRATWRQAQELCGKRGGSLLNKGWRYSNNPLLHTSGAQPMYPMGIVMNSDHDMLRYDAENDKDEIPDWDWHFSSTSDAPDAVYGAVRNEFWTLVNSSYIFFDVVCEAPTVIRNINMNLTVDGEKKIILKVNDTIKKSDILCFSDTLIYRSIYGSPASSTHISRSETNDNEFYLDNDYNGYYWCIQFDYNNYHVSESNRALYVNPKDAANLYACKIRVKKAYTFENLEKQLKVWRKKLEELIYYRTKYISVYGGMNTTDHFEAERVLKAFKNAKPELDWKDSEVITDISIRRLFLDRRTVLLHVSINPKMHPLLAAIWEGIQVIDWKPAYFCERFGRIPRLKLGDFIKYKCGLFKCIGNFNEGVQWVETAISGCVPSSTEMVQTVQLLNDTFVATDKPLSTDKDYEQIRTQGASEATNGTSPPVIIPTPAPVTPDGTQVIFVDSPPEVSTVNAPPGITTPDPTVVSTVTSPTDMPTDVITVTSSTDEPTDVVTVTSPPDESTATTDPDVSTVTSPPGESSTDDSSSEETTTPDIVTTPVPKVEEQIQLVLQDLENLLLNDSIPIESITTTFDQVNEILEIEEDGVDIPGQLLHMLDELGTRVELNGQPTAKTVRQNIALLLADVTPDNPVRGMRVAARETDQFGNDTFSFIDRAVDSEALLASTTEALVYLPPSVIRTPRRVSFVAFRNQQAFRSDVAVNSRIFSVNVENITHFENGEVIDIHLSPLVEDPDRNLSRTCAYWEFTGEASGQAGDRGNGSGRWSSAGCRLVRGARGRLDTCRCTHLTHFAEVLIPRTLFSEENEQALEILSLTGCFLSMLGLIVVALTAALFRSWRRDYGNKIWLQLCISIFVLMICFVAAVFSNFQRYDVSCMLVGVALHYSVLASFCWMLVAAVLSYRRLVLVFTRDVSHKLLKAAAFAWGAPCAIVGVLLAVDPMAYAHPYDDLSPGTGFCYPSGLGLWLAVYAPVAAMLIANWTLFALILRSVFASRRIQRHGDSNEALRCASVSCLLVFLFGLPWLFGLFATNIVAAYLFTLTATFQGFVLFVFFIVGNKKTRELWLNKLKIKQTRKVPVTSSTYTNRSTGWRGGGAQAAPSIEAKVSKPKSLSSPDDSRFS